MARNKNPWKSGTVVDCFDDIDVCVVTFCLPCLVFSENRSTLHGGVGNSNDEGIDPCLIYCLIMSLSACTLQCLYAYSTRTDIRRKYNLEEEPCDDCMTHICCHCCALCQEHRELRMYPVTAWPLPAAQDPNTPYEMQYRPQRRQRLQQPPAQYMPAGPQSAYARYSTASSSPSVASSHMPYSYAGYPQSYQGSPVPYVVQGGYLPMSTFPAAPPRPAPPQPLVYEAHRAAGPYGGGILPGIPAQVYHIPKFPEMHQGSTHPSNPSDGPGSYRS